MATEAMPIERRPEFAGILIEQEVFATGADSGASERINGWFDRLMIRSGVGMAPSMVVLLSLCSSIILGGLVFVIQENLLTTSMAAMAGMLLPVAVIMVLVSRRRTQMMKQLPGMIDQLARAARTGRSLEQCFQLVAADTPFPLGSELQLSARKLQMGVDVESALAGLPERTGLVTLHVLVTALCVHQYTGGDLVSVLERLSQKIRDRLLFLGRLRAATIASRATAVLMIGLPPLIFTFFIIRDPEYISNLMAASWGRTATMVAISLEFIGSLWVLRILNNTQRA